LRPLKIGGEGGKPVPSGTGPFEPQKLLAQMNAIWQPQANISFDLGRTDEVLIEEISPEAEGADITSPNLLAALQKNKDTDSALTFFLVRRAYDARRRDLGVTNAKAGVALIGDDRSENTMAHEA